MRSILFELKKIQTSVLHTTEYIFLPIPVAALIYVWKGAFFGQLFNSLHKTLKP